jgi:hypothetical protein
LSKPYFYRGLIEKAREIHGPLDLGKRSDYEVVAKAILKAYELVPEKFLNNERNAGEHGLDFNNPESFKHPLGGNTFTGSRLKFPGVNCANWACWEVCCILT